MVRQRINLGSAPNTKTGDHLRGAGLKINRELDRFYSRIDFLRTTVAGWAAPPITNSPEADKVVLNPGDNIQTAVTAAAEGTMFALTPGIYRSRFAPKRGQSFVGVGRLGDVILNGSIVLTGSIAGPTGGIYTISGVPAPQWQVNYGVENESYWASFREDLFVDGVIYQRVATDGELGPGKWRYDANTVRMTDNPTGKTVELGQLENAVYGTVNDVHLENLVIEKYATPGLYGAVAASKTGGGSWISSGWTMKNCIVQKNHGAGVAAGNNMRIIDCVVSDNGQVGITGGANNIGVRNVLVLGTEMARNNYAGFNPGWDCGGIKLLHTTNVTVADCTIKNNAGNGIWFDWENIGVGIYNNHVHDNDGMGIQIECGLSGKIIGNLVRRNTPASGVAWFWGAGILIQDTSNFDVMGNTVCVDYGDGIAITFQERTSPRFGRFLSVNNRVLGNRVVYLTGTADHEFSSDIPYTGVGTDQTGDLATAFVGANQFDFNSYVAPDDGAVYWRFYDNYHSQNFLAGRAHDVNSTYTFVPGSGSDRSLLVPYEKTNTIDAHMDIDPAYLEF